jgi:hypothetical protein
MNISPIQKAFNDEMALNLLGLDSSAYKVNNSFHLESQFLSEYDFVSTNHPISKA